MIETVSRRLSTTAWSVALRIADSKLIVLIVAALLASNLCPQWLETSAKISTEREWELKTREKALTSLDAAALHYILPLQGNSIDSRNLADLRAQKEKALFAMNTAMVQIRLLYGSGIMEEFRKEVTDPLNGLFRAALLAKTDDGDMQVFQQAREENGPRIAEKVDAWEKKLAEMPIATQE
jgi:hypothetical protein